MLKPKFFNILLYLFVKYIIFASIIAFKEDRFKSIVINNSKNEHELFVNLLQYIAYVIIFMLVLTIIFSIPIYFSFRVRRIIYFIPLIGIILVAEYFIYTYLASPSDLMNGIYNGVLSLIFLVLFSFKYIKLIFKQKPSSA